MSITETSSAIAGADTIAPLHPLFGAEVRNLDVRDLRQFARVSRLMDQYGVALFRGDPMSNSEHIAFSRMFGPLQLAPRVDRNKARPRFPEHPELIDVGNIDEFGNILPADDLRTAYSRSNALWHTDASFNALRGVHSLLHAHAISPGSGNTELVDMRVAYDRLPEKTRTLVEDLVLEHSIWYSRSQGGYPEPTPEELAARPPARHRLVQVHQPSGRKTLYLAAHASQVVGWPLAEGRQLIKELIEAATQPDAVYVHRWRVGDLLS